MRYLFLTESEADDLKRQDFMTGADLVKVQDMMKDDLLEPSHEDSPKETLENNFCEVGVLNDPKHKKSSLPQGATRYNIYGFRPMQRHVVPVP